MEHGAARLPAQDRLPGAPQSPWAALSAGRLPTLGDRTLAYMLLLPSVLLIVGLVVTPFLQAFWFRLIVDVRLEELLAEERP